MSVAWPEYRYEFSGYLTDSDLDKITSALASSANIDFLGLSSGGISSPIWGALPGTHLLGIGATDYSVRFRCPFQEPEALEYVEQIVDSRAPSYFDTASSVADSFNEQVIAPTVAQTSEAVTSAVTGTSGYLLIAGVGLLALMVALRFGGR